MHPDSEETARMIKEHNVEEDEGFAEAAEDPTVANMELHVPASLTTGPSLGISTPHPGSSGSSKSTAHSTPALGSSSTPASGTSSTQGPSTSSFQGPSTSTAPCKAEEKSKLYLNSSLTRCFAMKMRALMQSL